MVKRTKLTLEHTETKVHAKEADFSESVTAEQPGAKSNLGKMLLMAGLTIASLIIFKQKLF